MNIHVIKDTESDSKKHLSNSQNYRHLHLIGVQEGQLVGGHVPDL